MKVVVNITRGIIEKALKTPKQPVGNLELGLDITGDLTLYPMPVSPEEPTIARAVLTAEELAQKFPEELRQHLTVNAEEGWIKTKFVATELWQEMDKIARSLGYKYKPKPIMRWEKQ